MSQITTGIRKILSSPFIYNSFQKCLGIKKLYQIYLTAFVRPQSGDTLLDIGCGTALIYPYINNVTYYGIDIEKKYIEYAKRKFKSDNFVCQNVTDIVENTFPLFDIILANGLLHHLNDFEVNTILTQVGIFLKPKGKLFSIDCCLTENQSALAKFFIKKDRGQHIRTAEEYKKLAHAHFNRVNLTVRQDLLYIPYTHAIMECSEKKVDNPYNNN